MPFLHPYLDHGRPIAFAHRGGTSAAPENTMRAFEDAVELGYSYIETDVHATADGVLVAFHDPDLRRTCGINATIAESTWETVKSARVDGTDGIPLFADLLHTWPNIKWNIDCKSDEALLPLIQVLEEANCFDRVCIGSFSDKRLKTIRSHFGDKLCTSMGPREVTQFVARANAFLPLPQSVQALAAQVPVNQGPIPVVTARSVAYAHKRNIAVHVWTIDDPVEIARLIDLGVDGVMSDDTRALRDVFIAKGIW